MRLLLDTHVWLWMVAAPNRLRPETRALLQRRDTTLYLSAASAWEMAIKHHLGKLPLPEHPRDFVPPRLLRDGVLSLQVDMRHALEVSGLPDHHNDPFDRILVAQARCEQLTLLTADEELTAYDARTLRA